MVGYIKAGMRYLIAGALGLASLSAVDARAAAFPDHQIRMVVPWVVGGSTDVLARMMAEAMGTRLGQPIVVENRPGAAGTIGTFAVAKSDPNAYTILFSTNSTFAMAPHLYNELPYEHTKDLAPIGKVGSNQQILCINPSVPASTLKEFIEYLKQNPGKIAFASSGNGGSSHMAAELFLSMSGTSMLHVPYKGGAPSLQSVIAGETMMAFVDVASAIPMIQAGRLRPLGSSGENPAAGLPDVPTIDHAGLPGFASETAFALFTAKNVPPDRIKTLNAAMNASLNDPATREKWIRMGYDLSGGTPEMLQRYVDDESAKWGKLIEQRGIKAQ